ncbi:MAG: energy transducer TonB [Candidatus Saccharicenans sp.]
MKRVIQSFRGKIGFLTGASSKKQEILRMAQAQESKEKRNGLNKQPTEASMVYRDIFFVPEKNFRSKALALPLAIFIHLLFAAMLIALPLISVGSLPQVQVYSAFLAPIPSPTPPPAPPKGGSKSGTGQVVKKQRAVAIEPGKLVVPIEIPDKINEEELSGYGDKVGVPWGVDYGEEKNTWNETLEKLVQAPIGKEEEPVRVMGEIKQPKLLHRVEPVYPDIAVKARVEGTVILEATTDIYGRVQNIRVMRSVPLLDQAAIEAVRQWVYEPMIINGRPRSVTFTVTIIFKLQK